MIKYWTDFKRLVLFGSVFCQFLFIAHKSKAVSKISVSSGNFNTASIWSPSGVPQAGDDVTLMPAHTITVSNNQSVRTLTISSGAVLTWSTGNKLTIGGAFVVNGTVTMNGGNIHFPASNSPFVLGANSLFTWDPGTNTIQAANLFTNGVESFASTSTLIIKKWYNYLTPLGSLVTGNFGNLTLNSPKTGNLIAEWNQNNSFQSQQVVGTLTIDQGWITLDKSGSISNTFIGNIVLTSMNSSFYGHNGNHNSAFNITTNNITNNGGNFYGLNDGTGNVALQVNGNFTNIGNVKIINNTGVLNVCNGNAIFNVAGTFSQNTGDTRIIYNVTTLNSGTFSSTIRNLNLNGGIFMGQTAIHTSGGISTFTIQNNFTVNFSNAADKFRGTSLSSIGTTMNNVKLNLNIAGNLIVNGISNAEFTSSASSGIETITINGNATINGTTFSMNYGTNQASHFLQFTVGGILAVNGGAAYLSRNRGPAAITIGGNLTIAAGTLLVKGDTGTASLQLAGDFIQTGGNLFLHYNSIVPTTNPISMTVNGNFFQSGGILNYDNNSASSSATHSINLTGATFSISGNGSVTHAGSGTSDVHGLLNFSRNGIIRFSRTSGNHVIQQVSQKINNGCTLEVVSGDIQIGSHQNAATEFFTIATGGVVKMNNNHVFSNGLFPNSGITVDSGGAIKTSHVDGLYNGTPSACINASNNINYFLHSFSIVEYEGMNSQTLTGTGGGLATTTNHQYGILRINFNGDDNVEYVAPAASNVFVRTRLELVRGELNLNGKTLTIESGDSLAMSRINGYVKSEMNAADNSSMLRWKNMTSGLHVFPFGVDASTYIPVDFTPTSGFGGTVTVSTRTTMSPDNLPLSTTTVPPPASIMLNGSNIATDHAIDRWWNIKADGFVANILLTYRGIENTLALINSVGPISLIQWNGNSWNQPVGNGTGTISGTGRVSASGVSLFSDWLVVGYSNPLPIQLSSFEAKKKRNEVYLSWTTAAEFNNDYFTIEKSHDGIHFVSLQRVKAAGNSNTTIHYGSIDKSPYTGVSYYRLKQTDMDGAHTYSEIIAIEFTGTTSSEVSIIDFGPNPFDNYFWIVYECIIRQEINIQLINLNGELVINEFVFADEGYNKFESFPPATLPKGIYIVTIAYDNKKISQKILKK